MTFQVFQVPGQGAEDVVVALSGPDEGAVFTGTDDGVIHRISHDGRTVRPVANTGGRPLGIEFLPDGRLLVCDAKRGVLAVDPRSEAVETLVPDIDGRPMRFCNNAAVAADGTVYFSDSSTVYGLDRWKADFVERTSTGRLLRLSPDGTIELLLDGLSFANGVALAADGSYVAVAETAARTVVRYWLTGPAAGTQDLLAADLPGYPDNIARGSDGLIWVTVASPRDPLVEWLQRSPLWLRRQVTRIPERCSPRRSGQSASRPTTAPGPWCTTCSRVSPSTTAAITWSPASASTTAGSGSAAWRNRPSPSWICELAVT
jgi:sugar lactone lactonase YvrE